MLVSDDGSMKQKIQSHHLEIYKSLFFILRWVRAMATGAVGYSLMANLWFMMDKKKINK